MGNKTRFQKDAKDSEIFLTLAARLFVTLSQVLSILNSGNCFNDFDTKEISNLRSRVTP